MFYYFVADGKATIGIRGPNSLSKYSYDKRQGNDVVPGVHLRCRE